MKIAGLQRVSLLDYPGRIAATVFLAGCNLNCGYCHNRWMIDASTVEPAMTVDDLLAWLGTRVGRLDGVCVSGGEPLLHADLPDLLRAIKALGFAVKLDTNGTQPERLATLLAARLVDDVALDLKAPLDGRYAHIAGRSIDLAALRRTIALLREGRVGYEFRTTVCPGLDEADLVAIAGELLSGERWYLQAFVRAKTVDPATACQVALSAEALVEVAARLARVAPGVRIRGEG